MKAEAFSKLSGRYADALTLASVSHVPGQLRCSLELLFMSAEIESVAAYPNACGRLACREVRLRSLRWSALFDGADGLLRENHFA